MKFNFWRRKKQFAASEQEVLTLNGAAKRLNSCGIDVDDIMAVFRAAKIYEHHLLMKAQTTDEIISRILAIDEAFRCSTGWLAQSLKALSFKKLLDDHKNRNRLNDNE